MRFWGITGTNGKTTTAWILAAFINAAKNRKAGLITTVEVDTGKRKFYSGYTTPPLKVLKEVYAEMEEARCTDCVMEVSSHAIAQDRVGFGNVTVFDGGIFTNLSEDHLDYHKTMDEYFKVKLSFAERIAETQKVLPQMGRGDFKPFVVALDGENGQEMFMAASKLPLNVIPASIRANETKDGSFDLLKLPLVGAYNKSNVLCAALLALKAGVDRETIQSCIPLLKPRWGRLEKVENEKIAADVYVDFAHTPDGLDKVLTAAKEFCRGKLWVVFGAGGDRDNAKRPEMGRVAARLADKVVITSDNPRSEEPEAIISQVLAGVSEDCVHKVVTETDRRKAINMAAENAQKGDVVIIAGKGHETTQEIKGVKYDFDDRQVVRQVGLR
jgi:UDP-N-acetylmuramoyl-L-alanyl-D-glutamate--2,6-diaminopimelate ligase